MSTLILNLMTDSFISISGRPKRFVLPLKPTPPLHHDQVTLKRTDACAHFIDESTMVVEPSVIADVGCETPAINYGMKNGKSYRYFYAITSDVDADNAGKMMKVTTMMMMIMLIRREHRVGHSFFKFFHMILRSDLS